MSLTLNFSRYTRFALLKASLFQLYRPHFCKHRNVLALAGWINGKVANWSLHSHMTPEDVTRLFRDANAICEHTLVERPIGGDTLN
jgi:hypothetical protein